MTQWLGGLGVIVFSLVLLPLYGGEVSQLFDAETTGLFHDRFRPRVVEVAKRIWGIYMVFTVILIVLLYLGPMDLYDAVCHSMTTISTGGYSTKQNSIAHWGSTYLEFVVVIFMIVGAINFSIYYFLLKKNFKRVLHDEEIHWFLGIIITATVIVMIGLVVTNPEMRQFESFKDSLFQVVSLITTTGFSTQDYIPWGPFFWVILLVLMVICGCAGSTSGGLKVIRMVVLVKNALNEFGRLIHPRAVIPVRLNGYVLSLDLVQRLLAFAFLYVVIILLGVVALLLTGLEFDEAIGAAVTALGNVGPGLGNHGPSGSFSGLTDFAKWLLSFLMLVGRLELFTVLILFTPGFWKK
jgi:trk system potassium uptake protein TrkH